MNSIAVWRRMMTYLKPYRGWALVALAGIIGNTALAVAIPTILGDVIDIGIERGDSGYMLAAGALVVVLGLLRGLTGFLFRFYGERLSHYIAYDIRNDLYERVQHLSFSYHDQSQTGTLITRAISDVDEVQRYFAFGLIDGLITALLLIGVSAVMFATSPILALVSLSPLVPLAFASRTFAMTVDPMWKQIMERLQRLGNHIQENALGAEVVRAFNRENFEINKFSTDNAHLFEEQIGLIKRWGTYLPLSSFIIAFSTALVLFVGGIMERSGFGGVTVGLVVAFNAYILLVAQPIRFLGFVILLTTQAISSAERVFEVLDEPLDIENKPNAHVFKEMQGYVQFENVHFAYQGVDMPVVLKEISFEAKPGQVVALVGPTGAGKSTLISLIPRFYDVTSGRVTIDGVDVRDAEVNSLRSHIGMVLQQSLLFSASVRENIAYGHPGATEEDVIAAAKAANAHDFIMEFPEGYDTLIGERGITLSGGQRQRVAIARALLIDPRILILDDSTSSVDTKTERLIRDALEVLMKGRTTFIIAQRLNGVQHADQILVLENGEITERGTHDELLQKDGYYAEVYRLQLEDQDRVRRELIAVGQLPKQGDRDRRLSTDEHRAIINRASGD
ncbi:MAG: ABC transporter ATP-binding protein [Anaerolineae bacterium]